MLEGKYRTAGVPISHAKLAMKKSAASAICQPESASSAFVGLGGIVVYVYSFVDGEQFLRVVIDTCM